MNDTNYLGYEVGDEIFIFHRDDVTRGTVSKISPSGQYTVTTKRPGCDPFKRRFTDSGRLFGAGSWCHTYIRQKSEQDKLAGQYRRAAAAKELDRRYKEYLAELQQLRPSVDGRDAILAKIQEIHSILLHVSEPPA